MERRSGLRCLFKPAAHIARSGIQLWCENLAFTCLPCMMVKHLVEHLGRGVPSPSVSFLFHNWSSTSKLSFHHPPPPPQHAHTQSVAVCTCWQGCEDSPRQGCSVNFQPSQRAVCLPLKLSKSQVLFLLRPGSSSPLGSFTGDALTQGACGPFVMTAKQCHSWDL